MTVLQERVDLDFTRDSWGLQMHMLNVLFAFHALRYPKQYTEKPVLTDARHHPNEVALAGRNAAGIVISREAEILLLRDEPEKVAGKIRSGAAPVLSFLRSQQPTEPLRPALVEYGDVQIATNTFPADQYHLIDNRRRAVGADALLPPEDVITGMERYWLELGRQACPPLTVYIRDLVA